MECDRLVIIGMLLLLGISRCMFILLCVVVVSVCMYGVMFMKYVLVSYSVLCVMVVIC